MQQYQLFSLYLHSYLKLARRSQKCVLIVIMFDFHRQHIVLMVCIVPDTIENEKNFQHKNNRKNYVS